MIWNTPLDTQTQWSVTYGDGLKTLTYRLLENGDANANGTSLTTSMFTLQQFYDFIKIRVNQFLKETGMIVARASGAVTPGTSRYALPTSWLDTRRASYQVFGSAAIASIERTDSYQADMGVWGWENDQATPIAFQESTLPTATIELIPAPNDIGTLYIIFTRIFDTVQGFGQVIPLPDEFVPYIIWGVLADVLSGDGESPDPQRSAYAESRYAEGVEMARLLFESVKGGN